MPGALVPAQNDGTIGRSKRAAWGVTLAAVAALTAAWDGLRKSSESDASWRPEGETLLFSSDAALEDLRRASEVHLDADEELRRLQMFDYISPGEMLRDLHGPHGAECDRPDLDRRMIDELTPRR